MTPLAYSTVLGENLPAQKGPPSPYKESYEKITSWSHHFTVSGHPSYGQKLLIRGLQWERDLSTWKKNQTDNRKEKRGEGALRYGKVIKLIPTFILIYPILLLLLWLLKITRYKVINVINIDR